MLQQLNPALVFSGGAQYADEPHQHIDITHLAGSFAETSNRLQEPSLISSPVQHKRLQHRLKPTRVPAQPMNGFG